MDKKAEQAVEELCASHAGLSPKAEAARRELRSLRRTCAECMQLSHCMHSPLAAIRTVLEFTRRPLANVEAAIPFLLASVAPKLDFRACRAFATEPNDVS